MSIGDLFTAPDWGTLPDWLAAIGTISAVGVALGLAHRDAKRLDEERREAKAERDEAAEERALFREQQAAEAEERKRRLAAKVTLLVEPLRDETGGRLIRWTVHNGGDEPISMATVVRRPIPADSKQFEPAQLCHTWSSIEAGGRRATITEIYDDLNMHQGELHFTDGAGHEWQRKELGSLRRINRRDAEAIQSVRFLGPEKGFMA